MSVHRTSDRGLKTDLSRQDVLLLVAYADTLCADCRETLPMLEVFERRYRAMVEWRILDVVENPKAARHMDVAGHPVLVLYHAGREHARLDGEVSPVALEAVILEAITHLE